jgi:hypothetical protein
MTPQCPGENTLIPGAASRRASTATSSPLIHPSGYHETEYLLASDARVCCARNFCLQELCIHGANRRRRRHFSCRAFLSRKLGKLEPWATRMLLVGQIPAAVQVQGDHVAGPSLKFDQVRSQSSPSPTRIRLSIQPFHPLKRWRIPGAHGFVQ